MRAPRLTVTPGNEVILTSPHAAVMCSRQFRSHILQLPLKIFDVPHTYRRPPRYVPEIISVHAHGHGSHEAVRLRAGEQPIQKRVKMFMK